MAHTRHPEPVLQVPQKQAPWWARWSTALTLAWSAVTVAVALAWAAGLLPTPFDVAGTVAIGDVLNVFDPMVGIAFTLVVGVLGGGWAVAAPRLRGVSGRQAALVVAGLLTIVTAFVMLSGHLLPMLGYTPVTLVLGWFVPDMWPSYLAALTTPQTLFQTHVLLGVLVWSTATLGYGRATRDACAGCGRHGEWSREQEALTRSRALRIGRVAVAIAVACSLVYPAMRLPWLLGIPVGVDDQTWAEMRGSPEMIATGVGLGFAGAAGAVLILGLVANWGARFPRWMVGLSSRRVPVTLAVIPASVVALAFIAVGRGTLTATLIGELSTPIGTEFAHVAAFVLMLPYGIALLVAAAAYAIRRRAACGTCAQGLPETLPR